MICLKTGNSQTTNVAVLKVTHELLKERKVINGILNFTTELWST